MVTEETGNSQSVEKRKKQFNVTDLTLHQKHRIFVSCFAEDDFVGFDKTRVGDQTYYVFIYNN